MEEDRRYARGQRSQIRTWGSDDCGFDQPCKFGHRVEGHAVYCHNDAWTGGPRKCRRTWYTGGDGSQPPSGLRGDDPVASHASTGGTRDKESSSGVSPAQAREKVRHTFDDYCEDCHTATWCSLRGRCLAECTPTDADFAASPGITEKEIPAIDCPICGQSVRQVSSATLSLALWQHFNWMHTPLTASPGITTPSEQEGVVLRIEVFREDDGRFAAEYKTGDGREAGMGTYSATPIGALAELCCTLIKVDEDKAEERVAQAISTPAVIAEIEKEMRAMQIVAGQASVEHVDPLMAQADARLADVAGRWADRLASLCPPGDR